MKVFIQRRRDGLFLTAGGRWAAGKEDAREFRSCSPAIDHCVEQQLEDVRLWMSFDNPEYDFSMEVFRAETRMLTRSNKELREKGRALMAQLDQITAETKERKRQFKFPRKQAATDDQPPTEA